MAAAVGSGSGRQEREQQLQQRRGSGSSEQATAEPQQQQQQPQQQQQQQTAELLEKLASAVYDAEQSEAATLWQKLGAATPARKLAGQMLALAGATLCGRVSVSTSSKDSAKLSDGNAVRGPGVWRVDDRLVNLKLPGDDLSAAAGQQRVDTAIRSTATWVTEDSRRSAQETVLDSGLATSPASERRAAAVAMSIHWLMEQADYSMLRDRLGLFLPLLLQTLDRSSDSVVRLVGLDALNLMLDRAMAAEVQNFVPPLEHLFSTGSPLLLQGDVVASMTVAPYCSGFTLFLLKAFAAASASARSEQFDKFLYFGTVHCRADQTAFLLFLEFGLLPLLSREDWLVAPRLRKVTELLLQAAEGVNASEVLLAWRGLCLLFGGNLGSR
ncbi:unnamed protein product, partial [Polarella glacialis]